MTVNITIIQGHQGAGKTDYMREEALRLKGRYLFACPSIELIGEQVDRVKRINPSFPVYAVHSDSKIKGKVIDSVRYRKGEIEGAGNRLF